MGILSRLLNQPASLLLDPRLGLGTPWSGGLNIRALAYADHFQGELEILTREAALEVPAVARARAVLTSVIAGMPLRAYDADGVEVTPGWLQRTSSALPIWHRMAYTLDDLLFHGSSLWALTRENGTITDAARIPYELWDVDASNGTITVDSQPVPARDVLYIPGPGDGGLLTTGAQTLKGARAIERAWVGRAQNPIPLVELHQISDDEMEDEEINDLVDAWSAGRTSPTGAVGFTDKRVEVRVHGTVQTDLFTEARNATVLDVARLTNVPAALLDGSMSTATLTYSTSEGKANEFAAYTVPYWIAPLEARLSQDDVTPPGGYVRFDTAALTRLPQPTTAPAIDI